MSTKDNILKGYTRTTHCNHCCYCRTSEYHYCENPIVVKIGDKIVCGNCCYCRTGETMYCENTKTVT